MTHYRKAAREAVAAALEGDAHFADVQRKKAWAKKISETELPCFSVTTPREIAQEVAADRMAAREITLAVALRRLGDEDLEEALDLDGAAIEGLAFAALEGLPGLHDFGAVQTDLEIDHEGGNRLGTIVVQFRFTLIGTLGAPQT